MGRLRGRLSFLDGLEDMLVMRRVLRLELK